MGRYEEEVNRQKAEAAERGEKYVYNQQTAMRRLYDPEYIPPVKPPMTAAECDRLRRLYPHKEKEIFREYAAGLARQKTDDDRGVVVEAARQRVEDKMLGR